MLKSATRPLKAYDILRETRPLGLKAPMSIYRALDSLSRRKLARRIASLNAYVAARANRKDGAAPAYLICRRCGRARERDIDIMDLAGMLKAGEFEIEDILVEAFGVCADSCEH
ncbi:MAG TPA: hypothetical protein VNH64_12435 [Parvularculaceae bacterium]|nr:hypothetical protein [Parvularculaceae bacterium]